MTWAGRRVLVTGHTGFVGRWLNAALAHEGARVSGFSRRDGRDVQDAAAVREAAAGAEIVFHLAAQPLTREEPAATVATNVMGTVHVLEAAAETGAAVVLASSGEVYGSAAWPLREDDPLDPGSVYGASKAAAELAGRALSRSAGVRFAAARTPNLLGGGDTGAGRLVPSLLTATPDAPLAVRTPDAAHQWLHVLDAAAGLLLIGDALLTRDDVADAYNLAPAEAHPVRELVRLIGPQRATLHAETTVAPPARRLDPSRAAAQLGWAAAWDLETAVARTIDWHPGATAPQVADHPSSRSLSRR